MSTHPVRIMIADDHPLFRKGLRALLSAQLDVEVVGEATNGAEAVTQTDNLQPDVVLMDLQMPEGGGIAATREIGRASPNARVLVVTLFEDDDSVFAGLRAGARGYVLKDADEVEMLRAIRAVAEGEAIFSPAVATRVLKYFAAPHPIASFAFPALTERESEILGLIAQGNPNPRIARQLGISPKNGGELRFQYLLETPGCRPRRGYRPRPRGRPGLTARTASLAREHVGDLKKTGPPVLAVGRPRRPNPGRCVVDTRVYFFRATPQLTISHASKLGVASRTEAVALAVQHHLVD